ncbi:MAG: hypothetical protein FWF59_11630 [Turicibacter sp.]|nr:hypothetical protein [Turicibacter sp.]
MRKKILMGMALFALAGCSVNEENVADETNVPDLSLSANGTNVEIDLDSITIIEDEQSDNPILPEHLSLEEATLEGVRFVAYFFEVEPENMYVRMTYSQNTDGDLYLARRWTGPVWQGRIADNTHFDEETPNFFFTLDALTGDLINLSIVDWNDSPFTRGQLATMTGAEAFAILREYFPIPTKDEMNSYKVSATAFAERFFQKSNLSHLELISPIEHIFARVYYSALDEYGREISIAIRRDGNLAGFVLPTP